MRLLMISGVTLLLLASQLSKAACADETTGPDAFASQLVLTQHYGPGPDDGELLDMWLSHINETNPDLLAEPACYAPLLWDWPEFYANTAYSASDEYGDWDVEVEMYGLMDTKKLVRIGGVDYPYISSLDVYYYINWYAPGGSGFATTWGYTLYDVPPVAEPSGEFFIDGLPDGLPGDRLTYSLALQGKKQVGEHLGDVYYYSSSWDPEFPDSDYEFETDSEPTRALYFDLIMYYLADTWQ